MNKFLQKNSESLVSMFLGGLVVILVAVLAFNYFKNQSNPDLTQNPPAESIEEISENGVAAVKLPATHTVAPGETLWSIAEKYYNNGFSYKEIAAANNIADAKNLETGTKLTIPVAKTSGSLVFVDRIDDASYTVVKGDNLWQISVRAYNDGYRWVEIAKANNLVSPNFIHAGNILIIPR